MRKEGKTTERRKTGMARLFELAATKKPLMILSVVLSAIASIISFVPYLMIFYIVREIVAAYPDFQNLDTDQTILYGWIAFGGIIGNILFYFAALACSHLAAFGTLYELKVNFASHLAKLPLGIHVLMGSGKLRKVMDENIEKIEGFIAHQLPDLVASFVAPIVMLLILLSVDYRFGLAAIAGIVVAFVIEFIAYGNDGAKEMMKKYQDSLEEMNNASVEYVRGISVVKAFKQTVYSFRRLHETIQNYTRIVIPYTLSWENYMSGFITVVNNIYLFLIPAGIWIGRNATDYKDFAVTFLFYIIFVPSVASIMMKIMYVNTKSMQIISGVERMDEVLQKPVLSQPKTEKKVKQFDIRFDGVSFSYQEEKEVLTKVSFIAGQGAVTAIVGPSGGGKSTIAHLIPRFFDVTGGAIQIGGVDLRDMNSKYLMELVSFVFQDVFLFKQSVLENIRMGNLNATKEEIISAAKAAHCHEFIERLPQGYDTVIGSKGVHLSGGEKQRIAIARAIVKNAPIILLDEATAFTDPENEHLIQQAFEKLMKGKTVIMIAHRLSTIKRADHILVMDKGLLAEEGTHQELMEKKGKYYGMWKMYTETLSWRMERKEVSADA